MLCSVQLEDKGLRVLCCLSCVQAEGLAAMEKLARSLKEVIP